MARRPQRRIYKHGLWGQDIVSTTYSNATELVQWATHSCSRPQPATENVISKVDPIDPHPLQSITSSAPPEHYKSMQPLSGIETATLHLRWKPPYQCLHSGQWYIHCRCRHSYVTSCHSDLLKKSVVIRSVPFQFWWTLVSRPGRHCQSRMPLLAQCRPWNRMHSRTALETLWAGKGPVQDRQNQIVTETGW